MCPQVVEARGAGPVATKSDCTAISYKGLEHRRILVFAEGRHIFWNQSSVDTVFVFFLDIMLFKIIN